MESALAIAFAVAIGYWAYAAGERNGSKAAFKVGWRHARRQRRHRF